MSRPSARASRCSRSGWALGAAAAVAAVAAVLVGLHGVASARALLPDHRVYEFAELFRISMVNLRSLTGGNQGVVVLEPVQLPVIGEIESLRAFFYLSLVAVLLCGPPDRAAARPAIWACAAHGAQLRAARDLARPQRAAGCGSIAFAVRGAVAGFGGVLYAYQLKHVGPESFGATSGIRIRPDPSHRRRAQRHRPDPRRAGLLLAARVVSIDPVSHPDLLRARRSSPIVLVSPDGLVPRRRSRFCRGCPAARPRRHDVRDAGLPRPDDAIRRRDGGRKASVSSFRSAR